MRGHTPQQPLVPTHPGHLALYATVVPVSSFTPPCTTGVLQNVQDHFVSGLNYQIADGGGYAVCSDNTVDYTTGFEWLAFTFCFGLGQL